MTNIIPVNPLGFNVLVEVVISGNRKKERKTEGGIIMPGTDNIELETRSDLVKIIKSGSSAFTNCYGDKDLPPEEEKYAFIQKNTGQPFEFNNKMYRLVSSDHVLGTMNEDFAKDYCKLVYSIDI